MQDAPVPVRARRRLSLAFAAIRPTSSREPGTASSPVAGGRDTFSSRVWGWLARRDITFWALIAVTLVALLLRLYGIN